MNSLTCRDSIKAKVGMIKKGGGFFIHEQRNTVKEEKKVKQGKTIKSDKRNFFNGIRNLREFQTTERVVLMDSFGYRRRSQVLDSMLEPKMNPYLPQANFGSQSWRNLGKVNSESRLPLVKLKNLSLNQIFRKQLVKTLG